MEKDIANVLQYGVMEDRIQKSQMTSIIISSLVKAEGQGR